MTTIQRLLSTLCALMLTSQVLHAQTTLEQRQAAQRQRLRDAAAVEQAKVDTITADMERIDGHIEATVERIVDYLKNTADSAESRSTVTTQKREAIEALKRSIERYEKERKSRFRQLESGYSSMPKAELAKDIALLEERATKRADQIVALAQSFSQHKDYRRSYHYYDSARSVDASRRRQASNQGQRTKEQLNEELGEIVRSLKEENRSLQQRLNNAPPDRQLLLREQIASNDARIKELQDKGYAIAAKPRPARKTVSGREARANRDLIVEAMEEIQKDARQLETLKRKRDHQRAILKNAQSRLGEG